MEPWFKEWPDPVTPAIIRIDEELARTQRLHDAVVCCVCDKPGFHVHEWTVENGMKGMLIR